MEKERSARGVEQDKGAWFQDAKGKALGEKESDRLVALGLVANGQILAESEFKILAARADEESALDVAAIFGEDYLFLRRLIRLPARIISICRGVSW